MKWRMAEEIGYEPKTTFWEDFTIADMFGARAVKDTFNRAFRDWKNDVIYLTELVMVLNHKIFQHFTHNPELAELYDTLYKKADAYAIENLKEKELQYFLETTD